MTDERDAARTTGSRRRERTTASRRGVLRSIGAACALGAGGGVASALSGGGLPERYAKISDPEFSRQYVPKMVRAPRAWETTRGSDDVTIGMLGTGVDYSQADLRSRFGSNEGRDFVDEDDDPHPDPPRCYVTGCTREVHGTKAAGIASATIDDGRGMSGISSSGLLNARSIPGEGLAVESVDLQCTAEVGQVVRRRLAKGARYLVDRGADVINMSLSMNPLAYQRENGDLPACADGWDPVWDEAIEYALDNDVLVVSVSGNQGIPDEDKADKEINYPARKDGVLAVSGVGKPSFLPEEIEKTDGAHPWESSPNMFETDPREWGVELWGDGETGSRYNDEVDVCAPTDPLGPWVDRWYFPDYARKRKATSWAAPVVSGVAALALAENPSLSAAQLRELIRESARDLGLDEAKQGAGLVDAANAVEMA